MTVEDVKLTGPYGPSGFGPEDIELMPKLLTLVVREQRELAKVVDERVMGAIGKVADRLSAMHEEQIWFRGELERLRAEQAVTVRGLAVVDDRVDTIDVGNGMRDQQIQVCRKNIHDLRDEAQSVLARVELLEIKVGSFRHEPVLAPVPPPEPADWADAPPVYSWAVLMLCAIALALAVIGAVHLVCLVWP